MFNSCLTISDAKDLFEAISPEQNDLISKRGSVTLNFKDPDLIITINADDFTAYRAMESAVLRLLVTFYKINKLGE